MKKFLKIFGIVLASLVALVLIVLGAVQVALKPENGNKLLAKYLPQIINAEARYDSLNLNILSTWPYVELDIDGVLVRTLAFSEPDTLLYVSSLGARVNAGAFLTGDGINVSYLTIASPYIKAQKRDSIYSWEVVEPSDEPQDTTATQLPVIMADLLRIDGARLRYTDYDSRFSASAGTLDFKAESVEITPAFMKCYAEAGIASLHYTDSVAVRTCSVGDFNLKLNAFRNDTITNLLLFKAGSDAIALSDSMFNIERTGLDLYASAIADSAFSRFDIDTVGVRVDETTLSLRGGVSPDFSDTLTIGLDDFNAELNCPSLWRLKAFVPSQFSKLVNKFVFDGAVNIKANADGTYRGSCLPVVKAEVKIDGLNGGVKKYNQRIRRVDLDAVGCYNQAVKDSTFVQINRLYAEAEKNTVDVSGWAGYKNGKEYVDASLKAALDLKVINELYKIDEKQRMRGTLSADINGNFFLSDLLNMNLYKVYTTSTVKGDGIGVLIPSQQLGVYTDSLRVMLNTNTSSGRSVHRKVVKVTGADTLNALIKSSERALKRTSTSHTLASKSKTVMYDASDTVLVSLKIGFSSLKLWYQRRIKAESDRAMITLLADDIEPNKVPRLSAGIGFRGLDITLDDTLKVHAKRMSGNVGLAKNALRPNVPTATLRCMFDSITACGAGACVLLDSSRIKLATTPRMRIGKRKGKTHTQIDSMKIAASEKIVDLGALITLADTIIKTDDPTELFMKRFTSEGTLYSRKLRYKDADFPLRASISRLDLEINDDTIHLNNIKPRLGRSSVTLKGEVTNWRRYLLRDKTLKADFTLKSKRIDLNQIMKALYTYNKNQEETLTQDEKAAQVEQNANEIASGSDEEALDSDSTTMTSIFVVPKNWDFKFRANIDTLKFSKMNLVDFSGKVRVKDSRVKIKELSTDTEVGQARMNVMYACAVKDSANATIAIDMDSIQVGDLITYLPELDSIMPMLRSFSGGVQCAASAECTIDSTCNILFPSVNAALKLRGDSLVLLDGETFTQIAKLLSFSKKTENKIDSVTAEVVVRNNEVLIYPFMVGMDKYRLGVGGTQNLDMSFSYHVVVLKPTILSAIGLDVYGKDFDHIKFRVTSPKFKGFDVAIGKGGTLVKTSKIDLRQMMYDAMLSAILKEE